MAYNLSLLPADQKNNIELDKQASFLVWQAKQGKIMPEQLMLEVEKKPQGNERDLFGQAVQKYRQMMGV